MYTIFFFQNTKYYSVAYEYLFCRIHPRDKQDIADRLSRGAWNIAYGHHEQDYEGPFPTSLEINGNEMIVHYDNDSAHIDLRQHSGFEVRLYRC